MKPGSTRQRELRDKRKAEGVGRAVIWLSDNNRDALAERFPGPKGGIAWEQVIAAALNPPAPRTPAALPDNETGDTVIYWTRGLGAAHRCQAKNRDGSQCRGHGVLIRTERIDEQRCEFVVCKLHERAEFFTPHPSILKQANHEQRT
jgi:hypothetical protein